MAHALNILEFTDTDREPLWNPCYRHRHAQWNRFNRREAIKQQKVYLSMLRHGRKSNKTCKHRLS